MTAVLSRPTLTLVAPRDDVTASVEKPASKSPFRADIQGLRAVAILLVVLYHARVPGVRAGYVGVDVFFVISGFLITRQIVGEISRTGRLAMGRFYARRMRRLLPAALFVVTVTVLVARYWGPPLQSRSIAKDGLFTAIYAINFRLASEGVNYQQANGPVSPLQHFWSLAVEEQFYIVWPPLIVVAFVLARRKSLALVAVVIFLGTAASLYASIVITKSSAPTAYFSVQTRAWEFGFGALVALAAGRLTSLPGAVCSLGSWGGLALILGSAFYFDDSTPFPGTAALVPVIGCAMVIASGCGRASGWSADMILGRGAVQLTGRLSYSWYLWHWPILVLAPTVLGDNLSWIRNCELLVLSFWLAGITYLAIELPFQRGILRPRVWVVRGFALSAIVATVAVVISVSAPGIGSSGRFVQPLNLAETDLAQLDQALAASSQHDVVPGNLTPTLERAAADVPITQSGCHLSFVQTQEGPCVYGDVNGTQTVVLYGDSHAQQWQAALDVAAKALHWRLVSWTKAACPVSNVVITNPQLERRYTECEQFRSSMIDKINALRPAVVIVSQSDSVPGQAVTNQNWADQTAATVTKLRQPGTSVVFLADTPIPNGDVPTCVATHLSDIGPCERSRKNAYNGSSLYAEGTL